MTATLVVGGAATATATAVDPLPEPNVVPIQVTGDPSERLNLVVFGDGYQADQQSLFMADLDRNLGVLWGTEPFRSYKNYINIYAVQLASIDYGVHCDPDGRVRHPDGTIRDTGEREGPLATKNTALRLTLSGCNDPLARGITYGRAPVDCESQAGRYPEGVDPCETGIQAQRRILDDYVAPLLGIPRTAQNVQTLALANTFTYGGIGGRDATTSAGSPQGPVVSLHELGHSLGTLRDEYPYNSRDVVRQCYTGAESGTSFHHTTYTSEEQMIADEHKWFRWLGEESRSGGRIGLYESGGLYPCGQYRPSEHSMMRWVGYDFDQIGLEHMVARITGLRDSGQMVVTSTPEGVVPADSVLWTESGQPRFHELTVTWRAGGPEGEIIASGPERSLDLGELDLPEGTTVHVEVRDPVGPDGIDWVRIPSANNTATDSGYNGPRFVQTRQWTIGAEAVVPSAPGAEITSASLTSTPLARDEVVFVRTNHPSDRIPTVTWKIDGAEVQSGTRTTLDLGALDLGAGTYDLTVSVTDPANPDVAPATQAWKIDAVMPTAPRTLSESLATSTTDAHPIYFGGWDMKLDPTDSTAGYDSERYVVGQLRLNGDGWLDYSGFPEQPMPDSPFRFRHSGTDLKALTYGNLGSGGLSKAAFEQTLPDDHPLGGFIPGFGTHVVEHRAIDAAGNIGDADSYTATALPGAALECTQTLTGALESVTLTEGATCITDADIAGALTVTGDASVMVTDTVISGALAVDGAETFQIFGSTVEGSATISGVERDVTAAGTTFRRGVELSGNTQVTANERFSRLAGEYGPVFAGNTVYGTLTCDANSAALSDFGATNALGGATVGDCGELADSLAVTASTATRSLGSTAYVSVSVRNDADAPVDITVETAFGKKSFSSVAPGKTVAVSLNSRSASVADGEATVTVTNLETDETFTVFAPYQGS
ncbi:M64 family metallopeptidase [Microbacterium sp. NPDC055357]